MSLLSIPLEIRFIIYDFVLDGIRLHELRSTYPSYRGILHACRQSHQDLLAAILKALSSQIQEIQELMSIDEHGEFVEVSDWSAPQTMTELFELGESFEDILDANMICGMCLL